MKRVAAGLIGLALLGSVAAFALGLTAEDLAYLKAKFGIAADSAVIAELTPNEVGALHSAIDDLKSYPDGRDRAAQSYLSLVYKRECERWARRHPGAECSPAPTAAAAPGKIVSDRACAECHLFGTPTAPSFHEMAGKRDWNAHKVAHALQHSPDMVPVKLTALQLDQLAAYINSLK